MAAQKPWTSHPHVPYNTAMKTIVTAKFKPRVPAARRTRLTGVSTHLIGSLRGKIRVTGDIMATGRKWHAQS
jgi:hypothetical protein